MRLPLAVRAGWIHGGERWLADPSLACERHACPWHPLLFCVQMPDNSTLTGRKGRFWLTVREV